MTGPAVPLFGYQRKWFLDRSRFKIGKFARQTGKTFTTTLEVVDDCFEHAVEGRRARWVILSRGERQAREAMNEGIKLHAHALAAKVTTLLPADDRTAIEEQLSKQEDLLFETVGDWPAIPSGLQSVVNSWSPAPVEFDLDAVRVEAVAKVDRDAEAYRLNFITAGDGQAMTYQQKLAEARAKLANASIADAEIPHIVAEAEATGLTKAEVAQAIVDTFAGWQVLSAGIEGKRMAAKKAIGEAETAEAIKAASQVSWAIG